MELVDARFGDGEDFANLFEGQALVVIQRDDQAFPVREAVNADSRGSVFMADDSTSARTFAFSS